MGNEVFNNATGSAASTEAAPPSWSLSAWLITMASSRRTPIARRQGAMMRLPLSASAENAGPASNSRSCWAVCT
jgi:hypothetical protein